MRHGERVHHIHASGDPTADGHFADAEKRGAFAEVNGVFFEVHTNPIVSTGRRSSAGPHAVREAIDENLGTLADLDGIETDDLAAHAFGMTSES
jgi:hypothetical protein